MKPVTLAGVHIRMLENADTDINRTIITLYNNTRIRTSPDRNLHINKVLLLYIEVKGKQNISYN